MEDAANEFCIFDVVFGFGVKKNIDKFFRLEIALRAKERKTGKERRERRKDIS